MRIPTRRSIDNSAAVQHGDGIVLVSKAVHSHAVRGAKQGSAIDTRLELWEALSKRCRHCATEAMANEETHATMLFFKAASACW